MSACAWTPKAKPSEDDSTVSATKPRSALQELESDGSFKRKAAVFRNEIGVDPRFPVEAGRYHLYVSLACPWASRCLAVYYMKGLQDIIGLSVVHSTWQRTNLSDPADQHCGWVFRNPDDAPLVSESGHGEFSCAGCIPDTLNGCTTVRQLYQLSQDTDGKYTVPVLWDAKGKTIVNNESSEIVRMFNSAFNALCKNPDLDLYPAPLRAEIDAVNSWVYTNINDGVYKCGFAVKQKAYEAAIDALYEHLERAEDILSRQRFLCGNFLTEADIRLFVTLIRFDEVYVVYFKCSRKCLREFPNLLNYTRDIYQQPGVRHSINLAHIKNHYFSSHPRLNTYSIVAVGPNVDFDAPHGREKFAA